MKENKIIIFLVFIAILIALGLGVSLAYFSINVVGNDTASSQLITTGELKLNYQGSDHLELDNAEPGDFGLFNFTVTNSGTLPINGYEIFFSKLINTVTNNEIVYEITCTSSDAVACTNKTSTPLPSLSGLAHTSGSIAPGTTHSYQFKVSFLSLGIDQGYNMDKIVSFTITINKLNRGYTTMISSPHDSTTAFWNHRTNITEITFANEINLPAYVIESWDVSTNQDGSLLAYIVDDGLGSNTYHLHIHGDGIIYANSNSNYVFYNFNKLKRINNFHYFNTLNATTMLSFFFDCRSLEEIDLSNFETANATSFFQMFMNCYTLTSLDVSNFNTSKVTNLQRMFQNCNKLTTLDLSNFDTSKVITMLAMFSSCNKLVSINLTNFITNSVTTMEQLFANCWDLTTIIGLENFNTQNVTTMAIMFNGCRNITALNLNNFSTTKVTTMNQMFDGCFNLVTLNVNSFTTEVLTNVSNMFYNCNNLSTLEINSGDFSSITTHTNMFSYVKDGINITVKDANNVTWFTQRLTEAGKTGNVTI